MIKHIEPHIKAVFMDFDDTLVGTIEPKWRQHKFIAKTYYGKILKDEELAKYWGAPLEKFVSKIYSTDDTATALARAAKHRHEYPKILFAGTIPLLKILKDAGMITGIVSATTKYNLDKDLVEHNIPLSLIDYIQTADDTKYHKPDKRVFDPAIKWLKKHGIKVHEVLYIGDGLRDMNASIDSGFNFIGVETGIVTNEVFQKHGAKSIPSIETLI